MASVYKRGNRWWIRYRDGHRQWRSEPCTATNKTEAKELASTSSGAASGSAGASSRSHPETAAAPWANCSSGASKRMPGPALPTSATRTR